MDNTNETSDRRDTGLDGAGIALDRRRPLMRVDFTVNIPTLMTLIASFIALASTGVSLYFGLDKRQLASEIEITKLAQRMDKNESALNSVKADSSQQIEALRRDMRSDNAEIKDMLNRIIFRDPQARMSPPQQQLNDWRK